MFPVRNLGSGLPKTLHGQRIVRREVLDDWVLAEQLLQRTRLDAQLMLEEAREQCQGLRERARMEAASAVWRQADELLADWQHQQQQMWVSITEVAEKVVAEVLRRVLSEQSVEVRISALIQQLKAGHSGQEAAVLYCSPDVVGLVTDMLKEAHACWVVRGDCALSTQSLSLRTGHGDFNLDWEYLCQAIWPSNAAGVDQIFMEPLDRPDHLEGNLEWESSHDSSGCAEASS